MINSLLNIFFSFFSLTGVHFITWLLIIIFVIYLEERVHPGIQRQDIKFIVLFLLIFALTYISSELILKNIFQQPRPSLFANCPRNYSFPSTHAATAFASAAVLSFFDKKRCWFYYLVAVLIGISRIYLQCHYLIDVVGGALIGYIISRLILRIKLH